MSTCEDSPSKPLPGKKSLINTRPIFKENRTFTLSSTPFTLDEYPIDNIKMSPTFNTQVIKLDPKKDQVEFHEIENKNKDNQKMEIKINNNQEEKDSEIIQEIPKENTEEISQVEICSVTEIEPIKLDNQKDEEKILAGTNEQDVEVEEKKLEELPIETTSNIEGSIIKEVDKLLEKMEEIDKEEPSQKNDFPIHVNDNQNDFDLDLNEYKGLPLDIFQESEIDE